MSRRSISVAGHSGVSWLVLFWRTARCLLTRRIPGTTLTGGKRPEGKRLNAAGLVCDSDATEIDPLCLSSFSLSILTHSSLPWRRSVFRSLRWPLERELNGHGASRFCGALVLCLRCSVAGALGSTLHWCPECLLLFLRPSDVWETVLFSLSPYFSLFSHFL